MAISPDLIEEEGMSLLGNMRSDRLLIVACVAILLAACAGTSTPTEQPSATSRPTELSTATSSKESASATPGPAERATDFWGALSDGDREAAVAQVDPSGLTARGVNTFGRAHTLQGQFDWYEAVGWEWTLDQCVEADNGSAVCTAAARNLWSEVLDVDPVEGEFEMQIGNTGIIAITDQGLGFGRAWGELVFDEFADWVAANHAEDASVMFDFDTDVNPDILDLYRVNTERFIRAHSVCCNWLP
jgi:hypothetical protein